jgi:hypothetical protein
LARPPRLGAKRKNGSMTYSTLDDVVREASVYLAQSQSILIALQQQRLPSTKSHHDSTLFCRNVALDGANDGWFHTGRQELWTTIHDSIVGQ